MHVSVITPAYNAGPYVERAVASALAQPEVTEVLLAEDGSTDDTLQQCRAIAAGDARVKLLQHPGGGNRGAGAARNLALAHATQDLVAFLDADDYYVPGRFAKALQRLADPAVDGVYEAVGTRYESDAARERFLAMRGQYLSAGDLTVARPGIAPEDLGLAMLEGRAGSTSLDGVTVRRSVLARVGGFLEELKLHQDYHLLIRLALQARLVAGSLDRPVTMRWVHQGNRITRATREISQPYMRILWRDLMGRAAAAGAPRPVLMALLRKAYHDSPRLLEWTGLPSRNLRPAERVGWIVWELAVAPTATTAFLLRLARS